MEKNIKRKEALERAKEQHSIFAPIGSMNATPNKSDKKDQRSVTFFKRSHKGFQYSADYIARFIDKIGSRERTRLKHRTALLTFTWPLLTLNEHNNFSEKINEKDRSFSSRSEKTIPQFENKTLLEDSR